VCIWLLGPFILLIERSPADFWLSVISIAFVFKIVFSNNEIVVDGFWAKSTILFLICCLISAACSAVPKHALTESLIWFRFPVFAMATVYWLAKGKNILFLMLTSVFASMMFMNGILIAEWVIVGQTDGRLLWPYGDKVSGNYLAKVSLPLFCGLVSLALSANRKIAVPVSLVIIINMIVSAQTGERINFLIRLCSAALAAVVGHAKWGRVSLLFGFLFVAILIFGTVYPELKIRFIDMSLAHLPFGVESDYYRVMNGGLIAFYQNPILGVGPASYRELCHDILVNYDELRCYNHPHNFYIQFLAETGIVGLLFGLVMIGSIIAFTAQGWIRNRSNVFASTAFITPLAVFFPLASSGDFFGQWNNIFMWSGIALSLAISKACISKG